MNTVRRCVLYARLSVTKEESVSVARQLDAARKYAEGRGWEVVGEFIDDGVSATSNRPEDRKGWNQLLRTADFQAVVIWKVDRLARRVLDFLHVDEMLRERGAGLVAVEDPIDMTTPMGRAFATILAVFGEMEAAAIGSRVRAARAHLVKDGRWPGGGIPYGYLAVDNPDGPGKVLALNSGEIGWLRQIVRLAREGVTVYAVTKWLTDEGAPLPDSGRIKRAPGSVAWNYHTVDRLLRNPILAGMTPRNPGRGRSAKGIDPFAVVRDEHGLPVVNESLAVITVDEFTALQHALDSRATPQTRPTAERQRTSSFLSKVARCDACDVYMCRGTNQKRPVIYCPKCKQTLSRTQLDPYLEDLLLRDRGHLACSRGTVSDQWRRAWDDDDAKRAVLVEQIESLRIRRGVVGRRFDESRILLQWRPEPTTAGAA